MFYLFVLIADVFEAALEDVGLSILDEAEKSFCIEMMGAAARAAELVRNGLPDIPEVEDVFWKDRLTLVK